MSEDDTQPNLKSRLAAANVKADPVIDRALLWTAASGWSPVLVLLYTIACIAVGVWVGGKP